MEALGGLYTAGLHNVGLVPLSDVDAQRRCTEYLEKAVDKLKGLVDSEEQEQAGKKTVPGAVPDNTLNELKNTLTILTNTGGIVQPSTGRYTYKNYTYKASQKFWDYWDKIKKQVVEINEGVTRHSDDFNQKMATADALENGRTIY
ncbi:hypothetical protein CJU89_1464 [Yarrowia sp. B02]|nr:hypothetical protein CJU89_1464 [Yarrowia sp. B02]